MILYVFDQYRGNKAGEQSTELLLAMAFKQYAAETGLTSTINEKTFRVYKTQKGKPYLEGFPLHFSVSHSDHLWVCLMGEAECGVDIQNKSHANFEAISRRFYQPEEKKAVETGGISTFISIWCRKESFIKLLGLTIGDTIDWLNVVKDQHPAPYIEYMKRRILFAEIDVHPDYLCVAAMDKKEKIWIRRIQVD